jgi:hypothetical protein
MSGGIIEQPEKAMRETLCKFGWHPDPVIDFEIEIEKLESRFDGAINGNAKPGEHPETVQAVVDDIARAMTFKAGGTVEGVIAKNRLRWLETRAIAAAAKPSSFGDSRS